jgi:hypothetical protein
VVDRPHEDAFGESVRDVREHAEDVHAEAHLWKCYESIAERLS